MPGDFFKKMKRILAKACHFWRTVRWPGLESILRQTSAYEVFKHGLPPDVYPIPEFNQAFERDDLPDRYHALTRGLDEESLADVAFIINALRRTAARVSPLDIFQARDLAALREIRETVRDQIVKLADDMFVYRQYYLPQDKFDASVFYGLNGLTHLADPGYCRDKDILDVGGFIGDSALLLAPLTDRNLYIFEPVSANYEKIKKTLAMNHLARATVEHLALGRAPGEVEIHGYTDIAGSSSMARELCLVPAQREAGLKICEKVPVETLDHYVARQGLHTIGLIKVDIEGAERDFLAGAAETIKAQKPILLLSIYHNPDDFFDIKPMIESWNLGYTFKIRRCPGEIFAETLLIAEVSPR